MIRSAAPLANRRAASVATACGVVRSPIPIRTTPFASRHDIAAFKRGDAGYGVGVAKPGLERRFAKRG